MDFFSVMFVEDMEWCNDVELLFLPTAMVPLFLLNCSHLYMHSND